MARAPAVITSVVGSFPAEEGLDRAEALAGFYAGRPVDPFEDALRDAVESQVAAGIDWVSDGQVRADMITLFSAHIPGMKVADGRTTVVGTIEPPARSITRGDLLMAKRFAGDRARVKGILTGPSTLALSCAVADGYRDERDLQLVHDIARVLRREAEELVANGAVAVQIDEPFFSTGVDELTARLAAVDTIARGLAVPVAMHVCGDVSDLMGEFLALEHVTILDHEFAASPQVLDAISRDDLEGSGKRIGYGCVRSDDATVEDVPTIVSRIRAAVSKLGAENIIIDPDCGMRAFPHEVARAKLENMVKAAREVGGGE